MNWKNTVIAIALCALAPPATAAPVLDVTPGGLQGGNWVWDVSVTPDLVLAGGSTPIAVELGFRLSGDPLVNVTNVSPSSFDTNNPGKVIFGWETSYGVPAFPEGIEANCASCTVTNTASFGGHAATVVPGSTNEIFAALGSVDFNTPGAKSMLRITARGPSNGGPTSSTIQWLGAYALQGRIAQLVGGFNSQNFDFAGSATQTVPEPTCVLLSSLGAIGISLGSVRRRRD